MLLVGDVVAEQTIGRLVGKYSFIVDQYGAWQDLQHFGATNLFSGLF